jgi:hypothetical protein
MFFLLMMLRSLLLQGKVLQQSACLLSHCLQVFYPIIYDFATAPFWISLYMRKFSFLSVCVNSLEANVSLILKLTCWRPHEAAVCNAAECCGHVTGVPDADVFCEAAIEATCMHFLSPNPPLAPTI